MKKKQKIKDYSNVHPSPPKSFQKTGSMKITFETGATRSKIAPARYDLISPVGLRRLAETYAEGADIHGERNWESGLPIDDCINRAIRHIYLYLEGNKEEDHLAHAAWNIFASMHFQDSRIKKK